MKRLVRSIADLKAYLNMAKKIISDIAISAVFYNKPQTLFKALLERYVGKQEVQYRVLIEWYRNLAMVFKYCTKVRLLRTCGNSMLYCESIDKLKWLVRWLVFSDVCSGALLPYCLEPYEYHKWFLRHIDEIVTFIDVGAYVGGYSIRACKHGVKVISIEPDPDNFKLLTIHSKLNNCQNRIELLNIAAGDEMHEATLYVANPGRQGQNNLLGIGKPKAVVRVMPLDSVIDYSALDEPVMMKIDVEGHEVKVLKGSRNTLSKTKFLIIEIRHWNLDYVIQFLHSLGFRVVDWRGVNYFFVNKEFK